METVKRTSEYTIFKKRSGRYGALGRKNKWVNGEDKVKILSEAGLIKLATPSPKAAPTSEAEAATNAEEAPEASAE